MRVSDRDNWEAIEAEHMHAPACWACGYVTAWIGTAWMCLDPRCQCEAPPDEPYYADPDGGVHTCTEHALWGARTYPTDSGVVQADLVCQVCKAVMGRSLRYLGTWDLVEQLEVVA